MTKQKLRICVIAILSVALSMSATAKEKEGITKPATTEKPEKPVTPASKTPLTDIPAPSRPVEGNLNSDPLAIGTQAVSDQGLPETETLPALPASLETLQPVTNHVPEPATFALIGVGVAGMRIRAKKNYLIGDKDRGLS